MSDTNISHAPVRTRSRAVWTIAVAAVLSVAAIALFAQSGRYPKRFAEVVPGQIYRSGEVRPEHLERLQKEVGLKSVLSLLATDAPESLAEQQAARELGIHYLNVPLRGNGASTPADRERIKQILFDPEHRPLLVHCSAGANRTGLSIGMYRVHQDGWTYEQVLQEMKQFDFEDEAHHENLRAALREEAARTTTRPAD